MVATFPCSRGPPAQGFQDAEAPPNKKHHHHPLPRDKLDEIQKAGVNERFDVLFVEDDVEKVDRFGAELYSVITSLVSGVALMMVRGVPHGGG